MNFIRKQKINIGHLSTAYHTNYILMGNSDLEDDLGMDINWYLFGTGPAMVKAFKNEELDIGYMGLPPAIIGIDSGVPIKCVAGGHVEGTIMIGKKEYKDVSQSNESIYEVLAQFKGKSIGVTSKGSIHEVILSHFLKEYDIQDAVKVKNYGQAEFIAIDMKKGIIDGGVGTPALAVFASTILDSHLIIGPQYFWKYNPSYGIFFHENIMTNFPEIVIKFLIHHKRASFLLREKPLQSAEIISKTFNIVSQAYAKAVLEISPKYCIALSNGYVKSTMEFVNALYNLGYINQNLKINDIFNFKYVNQIHPEQEHY